MDLVCLTLNVRGLGRQKKWGDIRDVLTTENVDIAFFQELWVTHGRIGHIRQVEALWGGAVYCSTWG